MKSSFNVYDPMVQQALQAQGSQYIVPQPLPVGGPQPLSPEEQAMGAMLQEQAAIDDMNAQAQGNMHVANQPVAAMVKPNPLTLDWQPPKPAAPASMMRQEPAQAPMAPKPRVAAPPKPSAAQQGRDAGFEGMQKAFDERKAAAGEAGAARANTGDERQRLLDRAAVDDMMAQQELADAAEDHRAATAKVQQEQRDDAEFIKNYEPRDRRTTQQRTMGAIAVALSGLGDAVIARGGGQGRNLDRTLGIINQSIDRDIDLQQRMLDNKKTALAAKNTELGQMRERYGDTVDSIKLARAMKVDQYQRELDAVIAGGASQEAAAAAKDAQAQLELQKQQLLFEVYGNRYQAELKSRQGVSLEKRLAIEGKMLDNEKKRQELQGGPAGDKKTAEQIRAKDEVLQTAKRILQVRKENPIERGLPGYLPGVSAPAQLEALNADFMLQLKNAKELGALDAGGQAVISKMTGDPATWGTDVEAKLDEIIKATEREKAALQGPEAQRALEARGRLRAGAAR